MGKTPAMSEPGSSTPTTRADLPLPVERPTPVPVERAGPMEGVRVIELAGEFCAFAGRLLADAGADVIVIEPPGGSPQRMHAPFVDDIEHAERSLSWWAENTSKRSVVLDLDSPEGVRDLARLVATADVFLEAERPGRLAALGLDYAEMSGPNPQLVHVAITPFGRLGVPDASEATDLTILARGGPMWSCGYDDHELAPVRGRGNQGIRMAAHFAVMATVTALLARPRHGGQFVDVSMVAAANVTTEFSSYSWLAAQQTVQRQTGRHATPTPTEPTQVQCSDGRYLNTGVPPRSPGEFAALLGWIRDLDVEDEFPMSALLELGAGFEFITMQMIAEDPLAGEVFQAGREAMHFIASKVPAHDAFLGFQTRGIAAGVVWSPDEVMADPHFVERGFPTEVFHDDLGRTVLYPGAPIRFLSTPMGVRSPAPKLGAHTAEVLSEIDDR